MSKNYVKKHKGHDVPDGATHYGPKADDYPEGFYNINKPSFFCIESDEWIDDVYLADNAIELPEQDLPNWADAPAWADRALSHGEGEPWKFSDGEFFDCGNTIFGKVKHGGPSVGATEWSSVGDFALCEMRPIAIEDKEWDGKGSKVGKRVRATAVSSNKWENCLVKFCDKHSDIVVVRFDGHSEDTPLRLPWRFLPLKTAEEVMREMFILDCFNATPLGKTDSYTEMFGNMFDLGFTAPKGEG